MDKELTTKAAQEGELVNLRNVPMDQWWLIPGTNIEIKVKSTDWLGVIHIRAIEPDPDEDYSIPPNWRGGASDAWYDQAPGAGHRRDVS